jgi:hypothetical protein
VNTAIAVVRGVPRQMQLVSRGWTTCTVSTLPRPEEAEPTSVPGEFGIRLGEDERRPPTASRLGQRRPEHPTLRGQTKPWRARAMQDRQLMSQREDLRYRAARDRPADPARRPGKRRRRPWSRAYPTSSTISINARLTESLVGAAWNARHLAAFVNRRRRRERVAAQRRKPRRAARLPGGLKPSSIHKSYRRSPVPYTMLLPSGARLSRMDGIR